MERETCADPLQLWNIDQNQPGRMVMQPHTSVWYQNWRGPLVFNEVSGDFLFTSEVVITDRDDVGGHDADDVPGDAQFSLGGLMVRTPRAIQNPATDWRPGSMQDDGTNNGENYVFLSIGHATDGQFSLEVKTTRNSNSQLELTPLGATAATATDDQFTIFNDRRTIALDVLANDAATVGTLTIVSLSPTPDGAVTINAERNRILFRPAAGFFGETSFESEDLEALLDVFAADATVHGVGIRFAW